MRTQNWKDNNFENEPRPESFTFLESWNPIFDWWNCSDLEIRGNDRSPSEHRVGIWIIENIIHLHFLMNDFCKSFHIFSLLRFHYHKGYHWRVTVMLVTSLSCLPFVDVGDKKVCCWQFDRSPTSARMWCWWPILYCRRDLSLTSKTCHQRIWSRTFVTNIDWMKSLPGEKQSLYQHHKMYQNLGLPST